MAGDVNVTARELLMQALLEGQNNTQAAATSGYSRKHVKELLKQPAFARELARRREALEATRGPYVEDADETLALAHLRKIVADETQPGTARVQAAKELRAAARDRRAPAKVAPVKQDATEVAPVERKESAADYAARYGFKLA